MTITVDMEEKYIESFEKFIQSLPKGAVIVKKSLDEELIKRIEAYENGSMKTIPIENLKRLRNKYES